MKTRMTELLKIRHPIALGGMAAVTDGKMAAAVSEAGGLVHRMRSVREVVEGFVSGAEMILSRPRA